MKTSKVTYYVESHDQIHGTHATLEAAIEQAKQVQAAIDADGNFNSDKAQVRAMHLSGSHRAQQIVWPKQGELVSIRS